MKADDAQAMMVEPLRVRRREFLAVLASVVGTGLCPAVRAAMSRDVSAVAFDPAALTDPFAAEPLGRAYLAAHPGEAEPQWLIGSLERAVLPAGAGSPDRAEDLFRRFDRAVRAEYAGGDVVLVDGWLLSRSEARLYALSVFYRGP